MPFVNDITGFTRGIPNNLLLADGNGVAYTRQELLDALPDYTLIEDCIAGQRAVKSRGTEYLPMPDETDKSADNVARYKAYITRAHFYNFTKKTLAGLIGYVYARDPEIEVPTQMEFVNTDSDGAGISIIQSSKRSLAHVLAYGRSGLFVDYPQTQGGATVADLENGNIRPTIVVYHPREIRNWRTMKKGAKTVLALVVLVEPFVYEDDGFEEKTGIQYRVLKIENNRYVVEIHRSTNAGSTDFRVVETSYPTGSNGKPIEDIPFTFIGSENNDVTPDNPPLLDLADLNISHYRNSADYEESVFLVGQPTPVIAGLMDSWYKDVMKERVAFGARSGIVLNVGATAELLQAEPNTLAFEAMKHKEEQAVALGAKLVQDGAVEKTATEATLDDTSESSILSTCAKNVSSAYQYALEWAAAFAGVEQSQVSFEINTNFDLTTMDYNTRAELIKEWQAGAISFTEMRENLRRSGVATQEDDVAKSEIEEEQDKMLQQEMDKLATSTAITQEPDNSGSKGDE